MTKAEAVAYLASRGFPAFERDWAMGKTIGVFADAREASGITVYRYAVYLVPRGEGWTVVPLAPLGNHLQQHEVPVLTLENACARVEEILSEALCPR